VIRYRFSQIPGAMLAVGDGIRAFVPSTNGAGFQEIVLAEWLHPQFSRGL